MEYRVLGKSGLKVSRMGFGGIPIQRSDAATARAMMLRLIDAGVNFIDTARSYTVSEEYLGQALEGIRDKFILASKTMVRTKEGMASEIDISLSNLRTDYIDLYQVHHVNPASLEEIIAPGGALEALLEAKEAGKIGHIGLTTHFIEVFEKALELPWVETIMFPYNLVETHGTDLIAACAEKNIGFIDMKPLAGGALDDATLAIRFVLSNPNVTITIPGMAELKELEQNLAAANDSSPLSEEELATINATRTALSNHFCRRCNYCAPCTVGISIPSVFTFEGYITRYNLRDYALSRYNTFEKKASDCIGCGICESRCPYNLPIRDMLKHAATVLGK